MKSQWRNKLGLRLPLSFSRRHSYEALLAYISRSMNWLNCCYSRIQEAQSSHKEEVRAGHEAPQEAPEGLQAVHGGRPFGSAAGGPVHEGPERTVQAAGGEGEDLGEEDPAGGEEPLLYLCGLSQASNRRGVRNVWGAAAD